MIPPDPEPASTEENAVTPYVAARPLRRFLGRHNRQALLLSFFSLVAAVLLWGAVYGFAYWFTLVTFTVSKSFNVVTMAQINDASPVTVHFPLYFAAGAAVYLGVAAAIRRIYHPEKVREARMYFLWVLLELFMAVPNVTFSIWGNFRAITKLGRAEVVEAWRLLNRLNEHEGRLSLNSLPLEIEDVRTLNRVVFALQIIGVVGIRENSQGWFLYLQGNEVRSLLSGAA